ncbi:hypothetical protein O181_040672 [Austropuccinia psidii MF-1]|uniref:pectin lyase n=1 Tax=Austropuccinia psidii MF-1 TaxID=1389203 RepID=A0A9Q3DJA5_9BASI|nr:hypothetical protein [Austropuccinia psidii MF-1]
MLHSLIVMVKDVFLQAAKPFGFGAGVTGGGNLAPKSPENLATLKAWLADGVPRVILINKVYDFTNSEGNTTGPGCTVWPQCTNGNLVQQAINYQGWCQKQAGAKSTTLNYCKAAITPLQVGSRKTLIGRGNQAVIKGKGLLIKAPSQNVIIQGIVFTGLNPRLVWGGDAITLQGARKIWIDHCTFSDIGRQFIVSHPPENVEVTISNNLFNGKSTWSPDCSNQHYWTLLLDGTGDQVTLAKNCFWHISGRSPKAGGSKALVHHYNNFHSSSVGENMEVTNGALILSEGNVYEDVQLKNHQQKPVTSAGGKVFAPDTSTQAAPCQGSVGRACVPNLIKSGGPLKFPLDTQVLGSVKTLPAVVQANVEATSQVASRRFSDCGASGTRDVQSARGSGKNRA